MRLLHETEKFSLFKRELEDSDPDWDSPPYALLCTKSIDDVEIRGLFLNNFTKKGNPPLIISDPDSPINPQKCLPSDSAFFDKQTMIILLDEEGNQNLKDFFKVLILNNLLSKDKFSLIYCRDCREYSIGASGAKAAFHCTKCGTVAQNDKQKNSRVTKLYKFDLELKELLCKSPGRILEGLIYHQCLKEQKIKDRFNIETSVRLNIKTDLERSYEIDLVLIDKQNIIKDPIIILASVSSRPEETKEVLRCVEQGIETIYVCGRGIGAGTSIRQSGAKVFDNVLGDSNFPKNLTNYILEKYSL